MPSTSCYHQAIETASRHFSAMRFRLALAFILLLVSIGAVHAEPKYPALNGQRVVDTADLIPAAQRAALEAKLAELEAKTSAQVVVVTVPDLQGYAVEDFGVGLLRNWQLGQKDKNNGALILIAKAERKVRIEVGYGLEGALTDATTKLIISNGMVPRLRANDYAGALVRAVDDVSSVVSGEAKDQGWKGTTPPRPGQGDDSPGIGQIFLTLFIICIFIWLQMNSRRGMGFGSGFGSNMVILPGSINRRGYSGGGFSGGGFSGGGFSGGGGSGGGGGASGDF